MRSAALAVTAAAASSFASGQPLVSARQESSDTSDGWGPVLNGDEGASCAELAVIFARGTFDSGNIGPWVGAPFKDALEAKHGSVAFQGVDPSAYPADLAGYIEEGGSQSCADWLGSSVQAYAEACPDAKIAISGWSQGALCARKSLGNLGGAADRVVAFVTFGDPKRVWEDDIDFPELPTSATEISLCNSAPTDPLCGSLLEDFPSTPMAVIDHLRDIWDAVDDADMNDAQKRALVDLVFQLPKQALGQLGRLGKDIINGNLGRWMLTPEHFWYGMDGSVSKAAEEIVAAL